MTREQRWAVNRVGDIFKAYLEDCPKDAEKVYNTWKRGLITSDEAIRELIKKALPQR